MKMPIRKNIHNMPQGPPNPGFMQEKVQRGDFQKKFLRELIFFVLGSYESLEDHNAKLQVGISLASFKVFPSSIKQEQGKTFLIIKTTLPNLLLTLGSFWYLYLH